MNSHLCAAAKPWYSIVLRVYHTAPCTDAVILSKWQGTKSLEPLSGLVRCVRYILWTFMPSLRSWNVEGRDQMSTVL